MIQVLSEMRDRNAKLVTVKKTAEEEYMKSLMDDMKTTVWGSTQCGSWYANNRGVVTVLWPNNLVSYYNALKKVDNSIFNFS